MGVRGGAQARVSSWECTTPFESQNAKIGVWSAVEGCSQVESLGFWYTNLETTLGQMAPPKSGHPLTMPPESGMPAFLDASTFGRYHLPQCCLEGGKCVECVGTYRHVEHATQKCAVVPRRAGI